MTIEDETSHKAPSRIEGALSRVGAALVVLWLSVTLTFIALQVAPGDPLQAIFGPGVTPSPEAIASMRKQFGLDHPVSIRYLAYLVGILHGDLGLSYTTKQPVSQLVLGQAGSSLMLTGASLTLAWLLAVASVVLTTRRRWRTEAAGRSLEIIAASLPDFWLGLILITIFAFTLHWFPSAGGDGLQALVLPALALAIPLAGWLAQVMRQSFADALDQPFALTARARGVGEWRIRLRHALPHAVLPGLALSSWAVGWLIGGSVAIEQIFARKGIGTLLLAAVSKRDYPVIMGSVFLIAAVYVAVNLATDAIHVAIDPREPETAS
ncbi:hypothetical protein CCR94_00680 [Rhodoblastus sphagnicola]|uniref:Uncharacterized protein n=1 Tax=Rhodoblastus sphagnicola TaxID=333368 RepID=A0A2S6NGW3_9HYPH|nr:ABC transporter permease [Rhodoblastus sphagnicola]MBB4201010.1 peptide/nickel transport system permease protein [Rhodoblastus sphagnicola]PPQ33834.1 hypothetical protein CCR94_00680 [Rhodoblastus sphagnicola]